ncbi:MAG: hypothetical protein H0T91_07900 [Propionibacteriaceae bacterium]|nr:hypothetical protein [Propionibacteriaceae bacterium]
MPNDLTDELQQFAASRPISEVWPTSRLSSIETVAKDMVPLDDIEAHVAAVRERNLLAERAGIVAVPEIDIRHLLGIVSLAQWQTGFRNQTGRGSCYAFAAVAAMEAAYRRQHGVALDLSEQYAFHLNKAGELYPNYESSPSQHENNSSYWGFQGSSDIIDKLMRSAIPDEAAAPYLDDSQMEALRVATPVAGALGYEATQEELDAYEWAEGHIPTAARHVARYRVDAMAAIPGDPTDEQVQQVIASGHEVIADVPGHCFLVVGYNLTTREWLVKNSWGESDFITVPFDSPTWPIIGGRYVTSVVTPDSPPAKEAWWHGRWAMDHDGWRGELVLRRTTDYRQADGAPTKLGNYYRDGNRYDVNGAVEDAGQQLHFWIADTTDRVPAGSPSGQEFRAYVFSWEPRRAAGLTTWSGTPFGLSLSRDPIGGVPTGDFNQGAWLGSWSMDHDGWRGRLDISSVDPVSASYTPEGGSSLPVSGSLVRPHELNLTVAFSADNVQPFDLLAHTWENTRFSGTTVWAGQTFGVQGERIT